MWWKHYQFCFNLDDGCVVLAKLKSNQPNTNFQIGRYIFGLDYVLNTIPTRRGIANPRKKIHASNNTLYRITFRSHWISSWNHTHTREEYYSSPGQLHPVNYDQEVRDKLEFVDSVGCKFLIMWLGGEFSVLLCVERLRVCKIWTRILGNICIDKENRATISL